MRKISEERILQISNDIAEDMGSATKEEYRQTIRYWMKQHTSACNQLQIANLRRSGMATDLLAMATKIMKDNES